MLAKGFVFYTHCILQFFTLCCNSFSFYFNLPSSIVFLSSFLNTKHINVKIKMLESLSTNIFSDSEIGKFGGEVISIRF